MPFLKTILLLLILLNPILLLAQDEALALVQKMQKSKGNEKVDLLNEISAVYRKTDREKSMEYAKQAFKLAVENKYLPGQALAKKNEGTYWFVTGGNDSAMLCYKQALEAYTKIGDGKGRSACYNNLGLIFQETGQYDEAVKFYQQAMAIDRSLGDEIGMNTTKENLVDIFVYQGNTKKALLISNEILLVYKKLSHTEGIMRTLINRACIYDNIDQVDLAIRDLEEGIRIAKKVNNNYTENNALSNLGYVYWHKGDPDKALKILNQVLENADGDPNGYETYNTLWIMSEIYSSKKDFAKSNEILLKVLKKYEEVENRRQEAKVLTSLGRNLIELNELDKALGYLSKSLEITVEINAPFEKLENYRNLSYAYAVLHELKTADSLQDYFAQTYATLYGSDSTANTSNPNAKNIDIKDKSNVSDWMTAFLLFLLVIIISVFAFRKKE